MTRALAALLLLTAAAPARADTDDTLLAIGYVGSMAGGALATAVNGSHLAFGEGAPRGWRIFGYLIGGVDLAWGAGALIAAGDRSEGVAAGAIALAVGTASVLTAFFVDEADDRPGIRPVALPTPDGLTVGLAGRF
jgi:hypothetical protein